MLEIYGLKNIELGICIDNIFNNATIKKILITK